MAYRPESRIRTLEREQGRGHTPVVAVTASALADEVRRCEHAGMDDVLTKPLALPSLQERLKRWLPTAPPATGPAERRMV